MLRFKFSSAFVLLAIAALGVPAEASAKRVGVVVLSPHKVSLLKIGFTVFGNSSGEADTRAPEIGNAIYQIIAEEVQMEADVSAARVPLDESNVVRLGTVAYEDRSSFFPSSNVGLKGEIEKLAGRCSCDELLVVSDFLLDELKGTNQVARGATLLRLSKDSAWLVLPLWLTRFDAHSLSVTGSGGAIIDDVPVAFSWPEELPERLSLPSEVAADAAASLLKAEERHRKWGTHGLREALYKTGLRPSCALVDYEQYTPDMERTVDSPSYKPPPAMPPGADPARCK